MRRTYGKKRGRLLSSGLILASLSVLSLAPNSRAALFNSERNGGYPIPEWPRVEPAAVGMDAAKLESARDYALTSMGSGYITRHGKLVMAWGPPDQRYDLKSTTKSIGITAVGLALMDGKLRLDDKALSHQPTLGTDKEHTDISKANGATGWLGAITLAHLASQTAGFDKPGGYTSLLFEPGTKWLYSDSDDPYGGPQDGCILPNQYRHGDGTRYNAG